MPSKKLNKAMVIAAPIVLAVASLGGFITGSIDFEQFVSFNPSKGEHIDSFSLKKNYKIYTLKFEQNIVNFSISNGTVADNRNYVFNYHYFSNRQSQKYFNENGIHLQINFEMENYRDQLIFYFDSNRDLRADQSRSDVFRRGYSYHLDDLVNDFPVASGTYTSGSSDRMITLYGGSSQISLHYDYGSTVNGKYYKVNYYWLEANGYRFGNNNHGYGNYLFVTNKGNFSNLIYVQNETTLVYDGFTYNYSY